MVRCRSSASDRAIAQRVECQFAVERDERSFEVGDCLRDLDTREVLQHIHAGAGDDRHREHGGGQERQEEPGAEGKARHPCNLAQAAPADPGHGGNFVAPLVQHWGRGWCASLTRVRHEHPRSSAHGSPAAAGESCVHARSQQSITPARVRWHRVRPRRLAREGSRCDPRAGRRRFSHGNNGSGGKVRVRPRPSRPLCGARRAGGLPTCACASPLRPTPECQRTSPSRMPPRPPPIDAVELITPSIARAGATPGRAFEGDELSGFGRFPDVTDVTRGLSSVDAVPERGSWFCHERQRIGAPLLAARRGRDRRAAALAPGPARGRGSCAPVRASAIGQATVLDVTRDAELRGVQGAVLATQSARGGGPTFFRPFVRLAPAQSDPLQSTTRVIPR